MCRWMAWSGQPVLMEELLFKTQHGLVDQSLHSRMGAETTNGDGFGVGWYGAGEGPAPTTASRRPGATRTCASSPPTSSRRCSSRMCARRRAPPIQQTNCHPFRHGRWLFVHNGVLAGFHEMRRDLMLAVDPSLFADFVGSTDSEVIFRLALTFGLEEDPVGAIERAIGFVEATAERHGIENAVQASMGLSDGVRCGPSATPPRAVRARCSRPSTPARCTTCIRRARACGSCATRTGSWCPSRSTTCRACGTRSRSRAS